MPLGRYLLERNVVDPEQLEEARRHQKTSGGTLIESLEALGFVSHEELASLLDAAPPSPDSIEETGLDRNFLLHFLLKTCYVHGFETSHQLSRFTKIPEPLVEELLDEMKQKRLAEVLGLTLDRGAFRYSLTDLGRQWASGALQQCQYTGPAPVTLERYQEQVARQSITRERVTPQGMERALAHLVLAEDVARRLGPAVSAARSILLYGAPGNGKTSIAEALGDVFEQEILVPYCIAVDGQIVKIFDPAVHRPVPAREEPSAVETLEATLAQADRTPGGGAAEAPRYAMDQLLPDARWVRCRRPVVTTGGELTMEMLDLRFDPVAKFYEAPGHVKATGGVFIIDDFGRQRVSPQELVNRWILPLEKRLDYLTLHTGKKLQMPFDDLVVFSTNFPPGELFDGAGLRRIPYKLHIDAPQFQDFVRILRSVCKARGLAVGDEVVAYLLNDFYPRTRTPLSCAHPVLLVDHALERSRFEGSEPRLDLAVVREAVQNLIVEKD